MPERRGKQAGQQSFLIRLAWFVAIWAASVAALAVIAILIRLAL